MKKSIVLFTLTLFVCQFAWASRPSGIAAKHAFKRIGDRTTVCGEVARANYRKGSGREPTFLNMADTYPKQPFTVVIWGESRDQFDYPPESLNGKFICVTGVIETYRGKPQIIADSQKQIWVE